MQSEASLAFLQSLGFPQRYFLIVKAAPQSTHIEMELNAPASGALDGHQTASKSVKIRPVCGPVDPKVEETASERICRLRDVISNRKGSSKVPLFKPGRPLLSFDRLRDDAGEDDNNNEGLVVEFTDRRRQSCGRNTLRKFLDRSKVLPVFTVPRRPLYDNEVSNVVRRPTPMGTPGGRIDVTPVEASDARESHPSIEMQRNEESCREERSHRKERTKLNEEGPAKRCEALEKRDRFRLRRSISEPDLTCLRGSTVIDDIAAAEECNSEPEDVVQQSNRKRKIKRRKRKRNKFVDDAASESGSDISGDEYEDDDDEDGYLSDLIATDAESDTSDCDPRFLHRQWQDDMGDRMLKGIFGRGRISRRRESSLGGMLFSGLQREHQEPRSVVTATSRRRRTKRRSCFGESDINTFNTNRRVQAIQKENKERTLKPVNRQTVPVVKSKGEGDVVRSRASPLANKSVKRVSLGMRDEACELNLKRTVGFVRRRSSRGRPAGVFLSSGSTNEVAVRQRSTRFVSTTSVKSQHGVRRFIFGA